jgi:hypothetical protein
MDYEEKLCWVCKITLDDAYLSVMRANSPLASATGTDRISA